MLALLVREPFGHMAPGLYARLSDYQICEVYFAERDKDNNLVPFWQRQAVPGADRNGFPSAEELGVPREALLMGVPMDFVLMFWQVWRGRGKEPDWILGRFKDYLKWEHGGDRNGHQPQGRR